MSRLVFGKGLKATLLATAFLCASNAKADIVISGTRIVYTQSSKDVVVNLDNHGTKPLLVQTWLDDGRDGVNPQELKLPFIITPPVSRIDPKKGQSVRITYTGTPLPQDRESCSGSTFWKFRQNPKMWIKQTLTSFSWHSERVLNSSSVQTD